MTARQGLRRSQPTPNTHSAPALFDKMNLILKWSDTMGRDTDEKECEITGPVQKGTFASVAAGGAANSPNSPITLPRCLEMLLLFRPHRASSPQRLTPCADEIGFNATKKWCIIHHPTHYF